MNAGFARCQDGGVNAAQAFAAACALAAQPVAMQAAAAQTLEGYAAPRVGVGTANLDNRGAVAGGTLDARLSMDLGGGARAVAQGVAHWPDVNDGPLRRHLLRESYVEWRGERADVMVGRRVLVWGTGDGFNPTSTVTPSDFRFAAFEDFGERFGVDAARARLFLGERWSVSAFALPHFRSSVLPDGQIPAPLKALSNRDDGRWGGPGYALRVESRGEGLDFSLVAHDGRATSPAYGFDGSGPMLFNPRQRMIGFDAAATRGAVRLFAEGAWLDYAPESAVAAFAPRDEAALVAGLEYELSGETRVQAQALLRHRGEETPLPAALDALRAVNRVTFGQFRRTDAGATLTARADIDGERLVGDVTAAAWFTDGSWYLRARLKARIDDRQSLYARADVLDGPRRSIFGALNRNSRMFLEYRLGF